MESIRYPFLQKRLEEMKRMKEEADKKLEEKNLRIQELKAELQSQKQKNEELSKELAEAKSGITSMAANQNCKIFRAILNNKSKDEIQRLVELGADWKKPTDDDNLLGNSVLHIAAKTGNHEVVAYFISIGAEIDTRNANGTTPLMEAARIHENFQEVVDLLVRGGADLKATNKAGESALFIAVETGKSAKEVEMLCFKNFLVTTSPDDWHRNTVLHKAAANGNLEALEYCVSQKPDVNVKNRWGQTPLMSAASAKENFLPIVDLLLKNGADINAHDYSPDNLLHFAIKFGRPVEDLKKIVEAGAYWNSERILSFCIKHGHVEAVKYFIEEGADLFGPNDWEWGTLIKAAKRGMIEVIDILIEKGRKLPRGKELLGTPFELQYEKVPPPVEALEKMWKLGVAWDYSEVVNGFARDGNLEGIRYCVMRGADINGEDPAGHETPIYCAVTGPKAKLEVLEYLIQMGADLSKVSMWGFNLLHYAAGNYYPNGQVLPIIKKLLSCGVTWRNGLFGGWENQKESVLHMAARGGHPEVVQYFISEGADVDCKDNFVGYTPFLLPVKRAGEYLSEVCRVLVNSGADPNTRDFNGNNAILVGLSRCKDLEGLLTLDQMKVLVALGCDWRAPNKKGVTVLQRLQKNCGMHKWEPEVLEYFESLG